MKGSLNGIGLAAIVQLIGDLHHSGSLHLSRGNASAELTFDDGRLVAAQCGTSHGLAALAACATEFADGDFTFLEANGAPGPERTLDISASDLQKLLGRVSNGQKPAAASELPEPLACPLLGFADDSTRHYTRPTALHRCFAGGEQGLVTPTEQRELCLSGSFAACQRYRTAGLARVAPAPETQVVPAPPPRADVPPPAPEPRPIPRRPAISRGVLLVSGGTVAGLIVLAVLLLLALPFMRSQTAERPATVAFEPVATATSAPAVPVASPTLNRPTPAPTPTSAPRAITVPINAALVDVRFAAGPAEDWLDKAPYAAWSDGAYRLESPDPARFVAVGVPLGQDLTDVVVSATFRKTGGPPGGGYGLIIRDRGPQPRDGVNQEMNAYVLETGDLGEYGIWRRDGDHWVDLVPWTQSASVRSGGSPNDLSVRAIGPKMTFTVNGQTLASVEDGTLDSGRVGLFVGGDFNEVALDRFTLSKP